ncbi:unnamed protein product [Paramecium octaurelia]|uniref:Uncharacterized protein n=1 Tax=Paramecium octaurelia TaxID=43137 RepID=A0A8S1TRA0_PAROT|nr:unnamed protein product [Paramecium octaurelia]
MTDILRWMRELQFLICEQGVSHGKKMICDNIKNHLFLKRRKCEFSLELREISYKNIEQNQEELGRIQITLK